MPKAGLELPEDISQRLESAINRCMDNLRTEVQRLRAEVLQLFRFANMDEIEAAKIVLEEKGDPMPLTAIVEGLKGGGMWRLPSGAKGSRADTELKRSIARAATHGLKGKSDIIWVNQKEEIIGLTPSDVRKK